MQPAAAIWLAVAEFIEFLMLTAKHPKTVYTVFP